MPTYTTYGRMDDQILRDGDVGFVGFNNRLRPDQLQSGMLADAQNIRLDRNGEAQVRKGIELIEAPFAVGGDVFRLPDTNELNDNETAMLPNTIQSCSLTSNVCTLIITAPDSDPDNRGENGYDFEVGDEVTVSGIGFTTTDPNGVFTLTGVTDGTDIKTLTYALTGPDEIFTTSTALPEALPFDLTNVGLTTVVGVKTTLDQGQVTEVYASTRYSDPADDASQYILIASNLKVVAKNLSTGETTDLTYPAGETVPPESDMIQAFNKVFIFRNGQRALEWDGDFSGTPEFTKVASGEYSQPKQLSPSSVDIVDGKATATFSSVADLNGTQVGDTIEIEDIGNSTLLVGEKYVVAERDDSGPSISFFVQHPNVNNANGVIFQQPVSVGLGFTHMPAPPFGTYHQRRLVVPFRFDVGGTNANPTFTSRDILDEVIASDILDADTYDQIYGSYRFNAGTADFIVGLHSFSDDTLLVFNRNSIHVVQNSVDLLAASVKLLTDEVGCLARKSIQQVGNRILFLSDNGVYGTEFLDEYNLRGTQTPLSEPINETIKRINKAQASKAVSAYFDNRYFLAVPLDDALENNALLVYNFLNNQWESIDTVNDSEWDIENLIVAGEGTDRGLYCVNKLGGIHEIDSDRRLGGFDRIVTTIGNGSNSIPVESTITTRQFTYGTLERKKFKEFEIHAESEESQYSSNFDINIETENPDFGPEAIGSLSELNNGVNLPAGEDVSLRGRIGNRRGYGLQFTINNTEGRPRIRAIQATASASFRSTEKAI